MSEATYKLRRFTTQQEETEKYYALHLIKRTYGHVLDLRVRKYGCGGESEHKGESHIEVELLSIVTL